MKEVKVEINLCDFINACFELHVPPFIPMLIAERLGVTQDKWKEAVHASLSVIAEESTDPAERADIAALINHDNDPAAAHDALRRIMENTASHGTPIKGVH